MIFIEQYEEADRDEVIELVLHCQNDGSRPLLSIDDQPELLHIGEKYFSGGGGFWVAKCRGRVIGSIGLMDLGDGVGVLKKFFVYEDYRGNPHHLGQKLYEKLLVSARDKGFNKLILDTPKNTERAHKFYRMAGFIQIDEGELPGLYDYPYKDCDFFLLNL